jgi:rRNA-processing protein EBP2
LLDIQKDKDKSEAARRLRYEKKFALKVQNAALEQKQKNKRKLFEAVKNHRKGMKEQLETMLDNASELQQMNEEGGKTRPKKREFRSKMSRKTRNAKYGFGGQKKRSKKNDKDR